MPWEVSIVKSATNETIPLGPRQTVIEAVSSALPGALLGNPPVPPPEFLATLSPAVRDAFSRPQLEAYYEDGDLVFEFHTLDLPEIRFLCVNVRGNGNPLPTLNKLCMPNGWSVISANDRSVVDLTAESASQWEHFRNFRHQAFEND